jgi:Ca-activated chloride channel family protein
MAPRHTEVEHVRLVLLSATVTNARNRPVRGLSREDFVLTEDGVRQEIAVFAAEEGSSIDLTFLLDLSGSMDLGGKLERAKGAIRALVSTLDAEDRAGLIGFADEQVVWITDLTTDRERFLQRLAVQDASGRTALYDAVAASPALVAEQTAEHRAIVLITDGLDNASEIPALQATWLARRVGVPIYTLGFIPLQEDTLPRRARDALQALGRFSTETGGVLHPIHDGEDMARAVGAIQAELRFRYLVGYYPANEGPSAAFRLITLKIPGRHLRVRTRSGYYMEPASGGM